jgi:hypothetical protein
MSEYERRANFAGILSFRRAYMQRERVIVYHGYKIIIRQSISKERKNKRVTIARVFDKKFTQGGTSECQSPTDHIR